MKKLLIIICCVLLLQVIPENKVMARELTIAEFIQDCMMKNETLKKSYEQSKKIEKDYESYKTLSFPTATFRISDSDLSSLDNPSWGLDINKVLCDSGEHKNRMSIEKLKMQVKDLEVQDIQNRLIQNIFISLKSLEICCDICELICEYEKELIKYSNNPSYPQFDIQLKSLKLYWEQKRRYVIEDILAFTGYKIDSVERSLATPNLPDNLSAIIEQRILLAPNLKAVPLINELQKKESKSVYFYNMPRLTGNVNINKDVNEKVEWKITLTYTQKLSKWINLNFNTGYDSKVADGALNLVFSRTLATEPGFTQNTQNIVLEEEVQSMKKNLLRLLDGLELEQLSQKEGYISIANLQTAYDYNPDPSTLLMLLNAEIRIINSVLSIYQGQISLLKDLSLLEEYVMKESDIKITVK